MAELWRGLVDLLLPPACAGCGRSLGGGVLCAPCDDALPRLPAGGCARCQGPAVGVAALCPGCAATRSPLAALMAEVAYAGAAAAWVHRFKYPPKGLAGLDPGPVAVVAALVQGALRRLPGAAPEVWVPVPVHAGRLRERGFHPAALLAQRLSHATGVRAERRALEQVRPTASQTGLDRRARRRNVSGAFRARRRFAGVGCVALVDDVVTTGSTLEEAARALRAAGARRVVAVCAARTPAADAP